ncbi:DUF3710 domain-containing protein [uncultured Corynebacterium sp.]|uniref:DUF3710 domain-containing protein n=1 Tax=uncultured Corynebacterium sp. TaxID=159447 RepID=UPI0025D86598|nr:DUF3710 domain-containing protein [uncultured Corynebacterium sp.]
MWPFGKKNKQPDETNDSDFHTSSRDKRSELRGEETSATGNNSLSGEERSRSTFDALEGESGPFDSRREDLDRFDFSDFAKGDIDLGSLLVPIPHESEIQVEVSQEGPRAVHVASPYGRVTPVAFAAPRSGGLWEEQLNEVEQQITNDGLESHRESGPWGIEITGVGPHGMMHMVGVNGPGWMLRLTAVGPEESHDQLVALTRGIAARTIVKRGDGPMPAGETLPVALPQDMVQELQKAMAQRAAEAQRATEAQQTQGNPQSAASSGNMADGSAGFPGGNQESSDAGYEGADPESVGRRRSTGSEASARMESAMDELDREEDDDKY